MDTLPSTAITVHGQVHAGHFTNVIHIELQNNSLYGQENSINNKWN